ncbi:zinc finger protein ZFPM1 isoform X2 [Ictalurus punctatus]|uniref:Zinc finger protein ZFPM1 isoform X2 n=1 Tax=Ictalurus punctatus TaxID=7998 RepID=A0A979EIG1_ICTPU|nr:zinc finger protein ZFPM1 isoform X2 [Ictalurus punctatus]
MSRRKQSSIGDLDGGEDNPPDDVSLSGEEAGASDQDDSAECDESSPSFAPLYNEEPRTHESPDTPDIDEEDEKGWKPSDEEEIQMEDKEEEEEEEEEEVESNWNGPDDLKLCDGPEDSKVLACKDLLVDTLWGPFSGSIQSDETANGVSNQSLLCEDVDCWLTRIPVTSCSSEANCIIYSQGDGLYCKLTQELSSGDALVAILSWTSAAQQAETQTLNPTVKEEPEYPATLPSDIQLLPQQAGMAAILATAVVNKDIFPCKDCGIWYRSERNLQAHLMYYCASRQKQKATASPPQDKPKDSYPNERVCPFPQCNKSCPSASSLEIHMRTHSGERPFVCLICLSAFTTKANCERHLKVHTDTLNGVCHGCGFISTTRDILYSHLVTSHMMCQPGSRSEGYSPKLPVATGLSPGDSGILLKCQVCGFSADTPALLQQHVHTHLEVRVPVERSHTPRQGNPVTSELSESQDQELSASMPRPDSSSPGANGGAATSRDCCSPEQLKIKEEPQSDSESETREEEQDGNHSANAAEPSSPHPTSPKSPSVIAVKAEPTSPTPGSSPVHLGAGGSVLPGGALFLPTYLFSPEAAIMPQASEILAKMSEMVHSRLKSGQVSASAQGFYSTGSPAGVLKGATCFECDITFNNINNYYAHKRLYCSSRHQQGEGSGLVTDDPVTTAAVSGHDNSPQAGPGNSTTSASPSYTDSAVIDPVTDSQPTEVKSETPGLKDTVCSSSSEGEGGGGGRISEGSQSPAEISGSAEDLDEDPTRTFCQACNIRFSRHENYIVHKKFYCASRHDPSNHRLLAGKVAFVPQPIRTRKRKKMYEIHMARNEALASAAALPSVPGISVKQEGAGTSAHSGPPVTTVASSARSSSPESDGPIDLSKKPCLRENSRGNNIPALPLTDYHKCTACSISFNSIENYLAHKTYYCPATALQPQTREQLHRLKRPTSTSPKNRVPDLHPDTKSHQTGKPTVVPHTSVLPSLESTSHSVPGLKTPSTPPVICPYCPPNRAVTSDLVEHFRTAHGLVLTTQQQSEVQPPSVSPSNSLSPRNGAPLTPPKPSPRPQRDGLNGRTRRDAASPSSPLLNGSPVAQHPLGAGSPKATPPALSPTGSILLTVSPVSDSLRELGSPGHTTTHLVLSEKAVSHIAPTTQKAVLATALQNGNTRYCRLCNIKFSSLSTFIAHKKYYCSSHSAEHVK